MSPAKKPVNILVIRSATRILSSTLLALKEEFPDSRITLLTPEGTTMPKEKDPLVDEVVPLRETRRMSVLNAGTTTLRHLRKQKYDLAVSLYNVEHGLGYSNIDILAWASNAKKVRGYNPQGKWAELNGTSIMKKWVYERTTLFWVLLNYLATAILFSCITIALLGEWCFRKLSGVFKLRPPLRSFPEVSDPVPSSTREPSNAVSRV